MRLFSAIFSLLICFILGLNCSNLFDSDTSIGGNILDINFNGKPFKDSVTISGASSYVDHADTLQSGYFPNNSILYLGKWRNEEGIAYIQLKVDSIYASLKRNAKGTRRTTSFLLNFESYATDKSIAHDAKLEIGICNKKTDTTARTITEQFPLFIKNVPADTSFYYNIPLKLKFFDTLLSTIKDTFTERRTTSHISRILDSFRITPATGDTSLISSNKTYPIIPRVLYYDSIAADSIVSKHLIRPSIRIIDSTSSIDTTFVTDSIFTKKYQVLSDTVRYGDTLFTIQKDSSIDTIIQFARTYERKPLVSNLSNDTSLYMYIKSFSDSTVFFLQNLTMSEIGETEDTIADSIYYTYDTIASDLVTRAYYDCMINEVAPLPATTRLSAGASGRIMKYELDLEPFWSNMKDGSGNFKYKNIAKGEIQVAIDSLFINPITIGGNTLINYCMSAQSYTSIDQVLAHDERITIPFDTTVDTLTLYVEKFLAAMKDDSFITNKGYLYLWAPQGEFVQAQWRAKVSDRLRFEYIFMNTK